MHCTCTVQNTMFVPPYIFISRTLQFCFWRRAGTFYISAPCKAHSSDLQFLPTCRANAAMLLLCLWVAALKMKVCLNWGFGTCKREFVQACVCTSINEKTNLLRLCLVGSKFEAASVLGLRFWQMQKGIGSSLYLHIHKPKNLPRTQSGKKKLVYGCANTSLNKLPFALATTSIQTRSHLQSCYPANKEAQYFFVYGCANASLNKFPFARATTPIQRHVHLHSCYPQTKNVPPRLQKQNCTNCVLHSARTVHGTVHATQCTATKRCKYHGIGVLLTIYKKL